MATVSVPFGRLPWLRAKNLVFVLIGVMLLYVLYHNERFLINQADPVWQHYEPFKWWLLPHGVSGALALLLGPMQFSDRMRQRFLRFHRIAGRFYVAGVAFAGPLGFYIQYVEGPPSFAVAAAADAILWMTTTGIAFAFALKRKIPQHRQWMTRSYAVAIVFLEVRVILGLTGWERLGVQVSETVVWTCLAFALLFGDIAVQWQESRRTRPLAAKAKAAAV